MKIDLVTSESDLAAIAPEWSSLYERCPAATPFQSPDWLMPWWRCFAPGRLWSVAVHDGDRLVGLFPFFIDGKRRKLACMGGNISDYLDVLLEPGFAEGMPEVMRFLAAHHTEWSECEFTDLRPSSPLLSFVLPSGNGAITRFSSICPFVKLPASKEGFHAALSARQRRHLSVTLRKIRQRHQIGIERATADTCAEFLGDLFRLHASRWNQRTQPGVLSNGRVCEFHRLAAGNLAAQGALGLYRVCFDRNVVAVVYGMQAQNRYYSYIGGFDPAFSLLSPGMVALDLLFAESIRNGLAEFDFLRGDEPYKYALGARNRYTYCMNIRSV